MLSVCVIAFYVILWKLLSLFFAQVEHIAFSSYYYRVFEYIRVLSILIKIDIPKIIFFIYCFKISYMCEKAYFCQSLCFSLRYFKYYIGILLHKRRSVLGSSNRGKSVTVKQKIILWREKYSIKWIILISGKAG